MNIKIFNWKITIGQLDNHTWGFTIGHAVVNIWGGTE